MRTPYLRCFKINHLLLRRFPYASVFILMKYNIHIIKSDGSRLDFPDYACIDLDYWNIRQWRLMLFRLNKIQSETLSTLVITPIPNLK